MTRTAAVLGLGARGGAWARLLTRAGWKVAGFDPDPAPPGAHPGLGDWKRETTISATVRNADWVVCCLPDRLELLQMVIQRAQAEAPADAVVLVCSRIHDAETVQGCALRPARVVLLSDRPEGGFAMSVTGRNAPEMREATREILAELAAVASLDAGTPPVDLRDQEPDAESA